VNWADDHAMTVVLAANGYPGSLRRRARRSGGLDTLPEDAFHMMFHAGTGETADGQIVATGGRVLNATGRGATLQEARDRAYAHRRCRRLARRRLPPRYRLARAQVA
jgi:phosphoribosylamine--glycine ligase